MKKCFSLVLLTIVCFGFIQAQKQVVIIGSSTAFGQGANPYDSSWAGKLQLYYRQNTSPGNPDTVVTNLALGGQYTFSCMPSWYTSPPGYPVVNTARNITQAISLNPDVIIVNLPSNDQVWPFPKWMSMNNFRTIVNEAHLAGKRIFVTTTQPINNPDLTIRDSLRKMVDSIKNTFGPFAIDFWTPIVSPTGDSSIRADLNADNTHVNNFGHRLLFQQVIMQDLFPQASPLPLKLLSFEAELSLNQGFITWTTEDEEPNTKFEIQKSANSRDFTTLLSIGGSANSSASSYAVTDPAPFDGKTYYRLKMIEPSKTSYSRIVMIDNGKKAFEIGSVYSDGNTLHIKMNGRNSSTQMEASVVSLSGAVVKSQKITQSGFQLTISISDIAAGEYILRLADNKGNFATHRFIKLK